MFAPVNPLFLPLPRWPLRWLRLPWGFLHGNRGAAASSSSSSSGGGGGGGGGGGSKGTIGGDDRRQQKQEQEKGQERRFHGIKIQGLFLQRQAEVSAEFGAFVATKLLSPPLLWRALLSDRTSDAHGSGPARRQRFVRVLADAMAAECPQPLLNLLADRTAAPTTPVPNAEPEPEPESESASAVVPSSAGVKAAGGAVGGGGGGGGGGVEAYEDFPTLAALSPAVRARVLSVAERSVARLAAYSAEDPERLTATTHAYLAGKLRLEPTISEAMAALPSARFERVLHPVFEQDEAILIAVGAALGAVVGLAQAVLG
jgi:hypothetical protein